MILTHDQIISEFGGGTKMVAALEAVGVQVDREAVYKWRRNGIPAKFWNAIVRAASTAGKNGITIDLLEGSACPRRQTRSPKAAAPP